MARYMKKTTSRRRYTKKPKVSTAVKAYVKKATNKLAQRGIQDSLAEEQVVSSLSSLYYMDSFMISPSNIDEWSESVKSFGLKVKWVIHSNSTLTPITCRILVIENLRGQCNQGYRTGTNLFEYKTYDGSETDRSYNATTANLTWRVNDEFYKPLYDRTIQLGVSNDDGSRDSFGTFWIPYKKMLRYDNRVGTVLPERNNLAVLFIPIETPNDVSLGNSIELTAVGSWYYSFIRTQS